MTVMEEGLDLLGGVLVLGIIMVHNANIQSVLILYDLWTLIQLILRSDITDQCMELAWEMVFVSVMLGIMAMTAR